MENPSPKANSQSAICMVEIFASCKADRFDVTLTQAGGDLIRYRPNLSLKEVIARIPKSIELAEAEQQNIIIRPRNHNKLAFFVQLDDLNPEKLQRVKGLSFITIETSPNNYQAWLAITKEANSDDKQIARELRQTSGADASASGATRLAGTRNYKAKYAPNYPLICVSSHIEGLILSEQELKERGLLSSNISNPPSERKLNLTPIQRPIASTSYNNKQPKRFPDYKRCLDNAPDNSEGTGKDTSRADFTWCVTAIDWGWSVEETAAELLNVRFDSHKKHRNSQHYATLTATNAEIAVKQRNERTR